MTQTEREIWLVCMGNVVTDLNKAANAAHLVIDKWPHGGDALDREFNMVQNLAFALDDSAKRLNHRRMKEMAKGAGA